MVHVSDLTPWAPSGVCRVTTWEDVHEVTDCGFTWTRQRTCWPASGSVTFAEKVIWLLVQPLNWVSSARACSSVSGRLPVCRMSVGRNGGDPKFGGVYSSP